MLTGRRIAALIVLTAFVLGAWWWTAIPPPIRADHGAGAAWPTSTPLAAEPKSREIEEAQAPPPPSPGVFPLHPLAPPLPDGNVIGFEVVDGLAIAYGDVILGTPSPGSQVGQTGSKKGFYEAPTPELWGHPEIPFVISPDLPNPQRVEDALRYFRARTPVRFLPYSGTGDGIAFEAGTEHCYSALGKQGGLQVIKLAAGCGTPEIIHEIMHALGFVHEQSRPDRDQAVEILWDNIDEPFRAQYAVVPETFLAALRGSPFDYRSAMLYRPDTFARPGGQATMRARDPGQQIDPVRQGLSPEDIRRLNRMFGGPE